MKKESFWVLDIGNETTKVLYCQKDSSGVEVVDAKVERFDWFGVFDTREFEITVIKKAVEKAIKQIKTFEKEKKRELILGIPANIIKARIKEEVFLRREREKIISKEEAKTIIRTLLEENLKKVLEEFSHKSGILPEEIMVVKQKIIETKIDGYKVSRIEKLKGYEIKVKILTIFLPRYYLDNVQKIIGGLPFEKAKIVHEIEGLMKATEKDAWALYLNIGGEITQIYLVKDGVFELSEEFMFGGRNFTLALSSQLGLIYDEAEEMKMKYQHHLLRPETQERLKEIFEKEARDWLFNFNQEVKDISLPLEFYIFGGTGMFPEIPRILKKNYPQAEIKTLSLSRLAKIKTKLDFLSHPQYMSPLLLVYARL